MRLLKGQRAPLVGLFGPLFVRSFPALSAGETIPMHVHEYDHVSFLITGRVRAWVGGEMVDVEAPNMVFIRKHYDHAIEVLEDGTWWVCIHPILGANGDVAVTVGEHQALELGAHV